MSTNKKTYLFLLAWASGSDINFGEDNDVNDESDLLPEFEKGNDAVFAFLITVPDLGKHSERVAFALGWGMALHEDYTMHDSISQTFDWTGKPVNFNVPTIDITE
jgi:hypothetical protein